MQNNKGITAILSISILYKLFQNIVGAQKATKWVSKNCWRLSGKEKIIDIGCGPATILNYLPSEIEYIGIDISKIYIEAAKNEYGKKALFLQGTAGNFLKNFDNRLSNADFVMCNGLLHHLNDTEAIEVLQLSKRILKPGGRLICIEPTFLAHQGNFSKWLMSRDRGMNVRHEQEWKHITNQVFDTFSTNIVTNFFRLPYIHIIIECKNSNNSKLR